LEAWYVANYKKPYPTNAVVDKLAADADITVFQTKNWLAHRRIDTYKSRVSNNRIYKENTHVGE